jgi:hypothetical protein
MDAGPTACRSVPETGNKAEINNTAVFEGQLRLVVRRKRPFRFSMTLITDIAAKFRTGSNLQRSR